MTRARAKIGMVRRPQPAKAVGTSAVFVFAVAVVACTGTSSGAPMSSKQFKIPGSEIRPLAKGHGACIASDRILVDGCRVGYMVRTEPSEDADSGWQFFSGDETQEYCDDTSKFGVYDVNTVCNYDPSIIPLLQTRAPVAFARDPATGKLVREEPDDD